MKPKQNYTVSETQDAKIDQCQTPPYGIDPILPYIPKNKIIWECASGEGLMANHLRDKGYQVIETSLHLGQDFFQFEPLAYDIIFTNPPYGLKFPWIKRCYELKKPWALLLPVETLGSCTAQRMFEQWGMQYLALDSRVDFKMPHNGWKGSAQFPVSWFTHGLNLPKDIVYGKIDKGYKKMWKNTHKDL